jgi:peptide-methionine (S)-S-oxide reductase
MSQEPNQNANAPQSAEVATLGGGCFWCVEAVFDELKGVERVESGYAGGRIENPSYRQVCSGTTGHAEVIQITFDPQVVTFREVLEIFFAVHNPTTLNRQGADVGTQYRSVIFYHDEAQRATAQEVIDEINAAKTWDAPVVTEVAPFEKFYEAEDYHQEYFRLHGTEPYCQMVIAPKMSKFREYYRERLKQG